MRAKQTGQVIPATAGVQDGRGGLTKHGEGWESGGRRSKGLCVRVCVCAHIHVYACV